MERRLFTSESVTEGHPDKMCDAISDAILDALMEQDPMSRVACETATTTGLVMVMGEITTKAYVDIQKIVRETIREIGYDRAKYGFDCDTCGVLTAIDEQSADIALGVDKALEAKQAGEKHMTEEELDALVKAMDGEAGDLLLFAADKNKIVWDVLGNLRLEIARNLDLLDKNVYKFLWVTEFPEFEYSEEQGRYVAMHHPFTMPMEEDIPLLKTNPEKVRARAYDIVLNGTELGGGSIRIHQDDVQETMFEALGFTKEKANEQFGFLINAFKYGVPPHAGLAYGLDRLIMLMAKQDSIRDVIAFPKVKDASCLMTDAPNAVDDKQLQELCLDVVKNEEEE